MDDPPQTVDKTIQPASGIYVLQLPVGEDAAAVPVVNEKNGDIKLTGSSESAVTKVASSATASPVVSENTVRLEQIAPRYSTIREKPSISPPYQLKHTFSYPSYFPQTTDSSIPQCHDAGVGSTDVSEKTTPSSSIRHHQRARSHDPHTNNNGVRHMREGAVDDDVIYIVSPPSPHGSGPHPIVTTHHDISITGMKRQRHGKQRGDKKLPRSIRKFYKRQDELIDEFETDIDKYGDLGSMLLTSDATIADMNKLNRQTSMLSKVTFAANVLLLIAKLAAAILSGSLSIVSSLVDSCVDVTSGLVIWMANRAIRSTSQYDYPQGRQKLEPVAILVLSVIMSAASVQVMVKAVETIVAGGIELDVSILAITIVASTVLIKGVLYLVCRKYTSNASIQALAQDHRNDVLSNLVAILGAVLGQYVWPYSDPIGAIVISVYIFITWCLLCYSQIKMITGHTADPTFLKRVTWLCLNHDPRITAIDTVRAFHFGNNFIVEVDIVLPENMTLREAHDIGEPLQRKLERFPLVERAFVHLDYEFTHDPTQEHLFRKPE